MPPLGVLILDRDPYRLADFAGLLQAWLMDAGGFAAVGLVAYLVYAARMPAGQQAAARERAEVTPLMLAMAALAILAYSGYGFLVLTGRGADTVNVRAVADPTAYVKYVPPKPTADPQPLALAAGGLFALVGVGRPFARSLGRVRWRRLWALTRLGFWEALSNRLPLVFLLFLIPFLFPATWFFQIKPEDELRTTISVSAFVSAVLVLLPATLLAAFSIPNDIKSQNIHTVVTKPVERFEVVVGRFVGYLGLMTAVLAVMTAVGWFLIWSARLDPRAAGETYLARKPVRGQLSFASRRGAIDGTNVGREFDYRKYIGGHPGSSQRGVFGFAAVPGSLGRSPAVPLEFTFDIFRMTKGEENRGVDVEVRVVTHNCPQAPPANKGDPKWLWADRDRYDAYRADAKAEAVKLGRPDVDPEAVLAGARPGTPAWEAADRLAAKYGYFEVTGKEVFDYHPEKIYVPAGLFANAAQGDPAGRPAVAVYVKCVTPGQMLGMADGDLYFLEEEPVPSDVRFAQNYVKAAVGLWCRLALVIGLAVCCSTYLAGVISFLVAGLLFLGGYFIEHIQDLASGQSFVGGPFKAINQLLEAKQPTMLLDQNNPLTKVGEGGDQAFAWLVRRVINLIPDVQGFSWNYFVSEGFDIPPEFLAMNLVVLAGYLLPWFILGYFLIRSREVAA